MELVLQWEAPTIVFVLKDFEELIAKVRVKIEFINLINDLLVACVMFLYPG